MTSGEILQAILAALGGVASLVLIVFAIVQYLGRRWIDQIFERRSSAFHHAQAIELERLRILIDTKVSANLKLQEKEFETLSKSWQLFHTAYLETGSLVSLFEEFPNLTNASNDALEEFLSSTGFTETQKNRVRIASDKTKEYANISFYYRLHEASKARSEFDNYVSQYGIFFSEDIRSLFRDASKKLRSAAVSRQIGQEVNDWKMWADAWREVDKEARPIYESLEKKIHEQLRHRGEDAVVLDGKLE